jgi:hypothetical protein
MSRPDSVLMGLIICFMTSFKGASMEGDWHLVVEFSLVMYFP